MEEEEPSQLLAMFDFYWFDHTVLLSEPPPPPWRDPDPPASAAAVEKELAAPEPPLPRQSAALRRTLSDEVTLATSSDSALLAHRAPKLYSVPSGEATSEVEEEEEHRDVPAQCRPATEEAAPPGDAGLGRGPRYRCKGMERRRVRGTKSKSLSELEFEELKGFMDLGFTFSDAESDQRLLSIVPGLQRLGRRRAAEEVEVETEGNVGDAGIQRPYLSEAWGAVGLDERSRRSHVYDHLLRNWKVPAAGDGVDMKEHLRSWAHTVASAVQ